MNGKKVLVIDDSTTIRRLVDNALSPNGYQVILAATAEFPEEIDLDRAQQARQRAEQRLKSAASDTDVQRAEIAMARAANRITVHGRGRV